MRGPGVGVHHPANSEALVEAKSAGIDLGPVKTWAEQVLDTGFGPGSWITREHVEECWKKANGGG